VVPGGTGGITGLGETYAEHPVAIRRDFQQFYGLDIDDVWKGTLEVRRTIELLEGLAYEPRSQYRVEALGDPAHMGLDRTTMVLMDLVDAVQAGTYANAKVQGAKPQKPTPYPRPGAPGSDVPTPAPDGRMAGPKPLQPPGEPLTIDNFPIHAVVAMTGGGMPN
jgi:hypothetical protein